jgi:predicted  nucleic acid-binding Zn-ribbon protein
VAANIYQAVKQARQDLVAPQIESLKGEIGQLRGEVHGEIAGLRGEMGEFRGEVRGEIAEFRSEVRGEIAELRSEMRGNHAAVSAEIRRIDDKLTWALDLRERIVALETKLAAATERP